MSRLDDHVRSVRNRMMVSVWLESLTAAWLGVGMGIAAAIVVSRILDRAIWHPWGMLWSAGIALVIGSGIFSILRRPTPQKAAVAIDRSLGLKEKFSTALYMRQSGDPFSQAACSDAEFTAGGVNLSNKFSLRTPRWMGWGIVLLLAVAADAIWFPTFHRASPKTPPVSAAYSAVQTQASRKLQVEYSKIDAALKVAGSSDTQIKMAANEFKSLVDNKENDPIKKDRIALQAFKNLQEAIKEDLKNDVSYLTAKEDEHTLSTLPAAKDDATPMAKTQNDLQQGNLDAALADVSNMVKNFDDMTPEQKQNAAAQAAALADSLKQLASNPNIQKQINQQLMQSGMTAQQAAQVAAQIQQAAGGNQQAAQQVQNAVKQLSQGANGGQGMTAAQQKQMNSLVQQAQALANSQQHVQSMAAGAGQVAQAMQQAAQQSSSGQSSSGQHSAGQNSSAQSSSGQPKPGSGQQGNNPGQQMAAGQHAMQQAIQQMQNGMKTAQAGEQAADAAGAGAQQAANDLTDAEAGINPGGNGQDTSADNPGQPGKQGGGGGSGTGKGGGKNPDPRVSPKTFTQVTDADGVGDKGKNILSRLVKAPMDHGISTADLRRIAASVDPNAADEVDEQSTPRESQKMEKDYIDSLQKVGQ